MWRHGRGGREQRHLIAYEPSAAADGAAENDAARDRNAASSSPVVRSEGCPTLQGRQALSPECRRWATCAILELISAKEADAIQQWGLLLNMPPEAMGNRAMRNIPAAGGDNLRPPTFEVPSRDC